MESLLTFDLNQSEEQSEVRGEKKPPSTKNGGTTKNKPLRGYIEKLNRVFSRLKMY